ncbi:MAG: hypothetical protein K0U12_00545 [Gammaproteobacteria bacterium]|nr:hypothetical protein [Gammaproteobacteria bacterium]
MIILKPTINFSKGYINTSRGTKAIRFPFIYIKSINWMEVAIDAHKAIGRSGLAKVPLHLTDVQILCNKDKKEVTWHADYSANGILALIHLKGGNIKSGCAQYMAGLHLTKHDKRRHHLTKREVKNMHNALNVLPGSPGGMKLYHINSFHSRKCYVDEQRHWTLCFCQNQIHKRAVFIIYGVLMLPLHTRLNATFLVCYDPAGIYIIYGGGATYEFI